MSNLAPKLEVPEIDGMDLLEILGSGASGIVYKGKIQDQLLAVKVYSSNSAMANSERYRDELSVALRLRHPNIAVPVSVGQTKDCRFFVATEFVDGHSLFDFVKRGARQGEILALNVARGIASALRALHHLGLIHRDVKPENILMGPGGAPKLIDFGLAIRAGLGDLQGGHELVGSIHFASPEQLGLLKRPVDQRSDLFSLGGTIYYCLTGSYPFEGCDAGRIIKKHSSGELPAMPESLQPDLRAIVVKLLAKDPDDRFQTVDELLRALSDIENQGGEKEASAWPFDSITSLELEAPVGRKSDIDECLGFLNLSDSPQAKLLWISGAPGVGKTKLVGHLALCFEARKHCVLRLGGGRQNWAVCLLVEAGKSLSRTAGGREQLQRILAPALSLTSQICPDLVSHSGLELERSSFVETDSQAISLKVAKLLLDIFRAIDSSVIVVMDVEQECDALSKSVFSKISDFHASFGMIACGNGDSPMFSWAGPVHRLSLRNLGISDMMPFAQWFFGQRPVQGLDAGKTHTLSMGNPRILEDSFHFLLKNGKVQLRAGTVHVDSKEFDAFEFHKGAQLIIEDKIASMQEDERIVLFACAVLGAACRQEILMELCKLGPHRYRKAMGTLLRSGLLIEAKGGYEFPHFRIRESVVEAIPSNELKSLHINSARIFSQNDGAHGELDLGDHFLFGSIEDNPKAALNALLKSGRKAIGEFNFPRAEDCYKGALFALKLIGDRDAAAYAEALEGVGVSQQGLGRHGEAVINFEECLRLGLDKSRELRLRIYLVKALIADLRARDAWTQYMLLLRMLGEPFHDTRIKAWIDFVWAIVRGLLIRKGRELSSAESRRIHALANLYELIGYFGTYLARVDISLKFLSKLFYVARKLQKGPERAKVYSLMAVCLGMGGFHKLISRFQRAAFADAEDLDDPSLLERLKVDEAMAIHFSGDCRTAQRLQQEAIRKAQWMRAEVLLRAVNDLSLNLWMRGYSNQALEWLLPAIEKARVLGFANRAVFPMLTAFVNFARMDRLSEAGQQLEKVEKLRANTPLDKMVYNLYLSARLDYLVAVGSPDEDAEKVISEFETLRIDPVNADHFYQHIYVHIAYYRFMLLEPSPESLMKREKFQAALENLKKVRHGSYRCHYWIFMAALSRMNGRKGQFAKHIARARKLAAKVDSEWARIQILIEEAKLLRSQRHTDDAQARAQLALTKANGAGLIRLGHRVAREFGLSGFQGGDLSRTVLGASSKFEILPLKKQSEILTKLSLLMTQSLDVKDQVSSALDAIIDLLGAERGFIFLTDEKGNELKLSGGRDKERQDVAALEGFSGTIVAEVFRSGQPALLMADDHSRVDLSKSIVTHGLKSIIAGPLLLKGKVTGVVYVDSTVIKGLFSDEDVPMFMGIVGHISIVLEIAKIARLEKEKVALEKDLALTGAVQSLFLPKHGGFSNERISLRSHYLPAAEASGDWWWYAKNEEEGKLQILVGDVTGHGAPSAMMTAATAGIVGTLIQMQKERGMEDLLNLLNAEFYRIAHEDYFMTMAAIEISIEPGKLKLFNAAAPPIYVLKPDSKIKSLLARSSPIGSNRFEMGSADYDLSSGDRLFILTDGVLEMSLANGSKVRLREVMRILAETRALDTDAAGKYVFDELRRLRGSTPINDDMTMVIVDYLPASR